MFLETLLSGISDSSKLTLIIIATLPLIWVVSAIYSCWFHPYADIPGPLGARISRLWLAKQVLQGNIDKVQRDLHDKYGKATTVKFSCYDTSLAYFWCAGPIVRIAPNEVSVSDPAALKLIYAVNAGFTKTDFYAPFASHISPNEDLFTQRDEKHHAHRRRLVNALYSLSSVLESERFIDACTATFMSRLDEFVDSGETVDLGLWLQMYAFDVVGELFYGRQFGFMETRSDYEGYIKSLDTLLPAVAAASVLPSYVRPFQVLGHLLPQVHKALVCYDNIVIAAKQTVNNRMQLMREGGVKR